MQTPANPRVRQRSGKPHHASPCEHLHTRQGSWSHPGRIRPAGSAPSEYRPIPPRILVRAASSTERSNPPSPL